MLSASPYREGGVGATTLRAAAAPAPGAEVDLLPEHIEVSAAVDARFVGGDA